LLVSPLIGKSQLSRRDTIDVSIGDTLINLSKTHIVRDSVEVWTETQEYEFEKIRIKTPPGLLIFSPPARGSMQVYVDYNYIPISLSLINYLNEPPRTYMGKNNNSNTKKSKGLEFSKNTKNVQYDFLQSGSITRGIDLKSNSGVSIESGLDLELEGRFTENITIKGALTDKNVPIQPEGTTQRLNELDKIFMSIQMPNEVFTFGDFKLNIKNGKYGQYSRKLQGVKLSSERDQYNGVLAGAVSQGTFHTIKFKGEEGRQGPYQLRGKNGEETIIILAGTEEVYINGERMKRGENNDYTIDYSTGEITFTSNQLITSNSRITVDFQYSDLVYQRNIVSTSNEFSIMKNNLKISGGYIAETDGKNNPVEMEIDSSDREKLKMLGDTTGRVLKNTIRKDSTGNYFLRDSILVFAGENQGTYTASFYNVGEKGKYRKHYESDRVYFEYVDKNDPNIPQNKKNEAVYLPAKPLNLPQKHQLYHFRTRWLPSQKFKMDLELTGSALDKNTFSNLEDGDNQAGAIKFSTQYKTTKTKYGNMVLHADYIQEGKKFEPIYRSNIVEYDRKWDLEKTYPKDKKVYETDLAYEYRDKIKMNLSGGKMKYGPYSTNRIDGNVNLEYKNLNNFSYSIEDITTAKSEVRFKKWTRSDLNTRIDIFNFESYYRYDGEKKLNDSLSNENFRFKEHTLGLTPQKQESGKYDWNINYRTRANHIKENGKWKKESRSRDLGVQGKINEWKNLTAKLKWVGRRKKYFNSQKSNIQYYLLKGSLRHDTYKLPFRWQKNIKVDERYTVKKEEVYYKVDRGRGEYRYDSTYAEYVPHPRGNYIRRIVRTNIHSPTTHFQTGFRVDFDGDRLNSDKTVDFIRNISSRTRLRLNQEINSNHNLMNLYRMSSKDIDSSWSMYYRRFKQEFKYEINPVDGRVKIQYQNNTRIDDENVRGKEKTFTEKYSLNYKGNCMFGINIESEFSRHHRKRESWINLRRSHNINGYSFENQFSYRFANNDQISLNVAYNKDWENQKYNIKSNLIKTRVEYQKQILKKALGRIFFEYDRVGVKPKDINLPWQMSEGKRAGQTFGYGTFLEYSLGRHISLSLNYEGWKEPQLPFYQSGNLEIRAYF